MSVVSVNDILNIPNSALKSDFVGCYADSNPKLYSDYLGDHKIHKCNAKALEKGYKYFGLQSPQGLTDEKSKCYGGNTDPGTTPYVTATCSGNVDSNGNNLGGTNLNAIYKVSQTASLPNDILLNASTFDNWLLGSVEGENVQIQNPTTDPISVSVLYTKNMKGSGDILDTIDHGDIINGGNIKIYSVSGNSTMNIPCDDNNLGPDPFPGYQKICYKKKNTKAIVGRYLKIQAGLRPCCMNWGNIYVYGKVGNTNIARGAKVYMSSGYSSGSGATLNTDTYPGSNLVDDNPDTFAHTNCSDTNYSWMIVDLGNNVPIRKIILASRQNCCSERGIGSTLTIYSEDRNKVYQSGGFPNTDNSTSAPLSDPGGASAKAYKYYIITPPLQGVIGTNNMNFNEDYIMEHFDGQEESNLLMYIIIILFVIFLLYTFAR